MSRAFCSVENNDEPLAGTAPGGIHTWLGIELSGAWNARALQSDGITDALRDVLTMWQATAGRRMQFLKQSTPVPPTVWFAADGVLWSWLLTSAEALAEELTAGPPAHATRHDESVLWICTHGKRDMCCAKWGLPVYRAMVEDGRVRTVQTSHLGGHRFAATALLLPEGLLYGRLCPTDVPELAAHVTAGTLWLDRLRGRSALSMAGQAAEIAVRQHTGDTVNRDISAVDDDGTVTVALNGVSHPVHTERIEGPTTLASCSGTKKVSKRWMARLS
ncbi:MAG: hypothetical protein ACJATT_003056 [Myxococcota bacterium]